MFPEGGDWLWRPLLPRCFRATGRGAGLVDQAGGAGVRP